MGKRKNREEHLRNRIAKLLVNNKNVNPQIIEPPKIEEPIEELESPRGSLPQETEIELSQEELAPQPITEEVIVEPKAEVTFAEPEVKAEAIIVEPEVETVVEPEPVVEQEPEIVNLDPTPEPEPEQQVLSELPSDLFPKSADSELAEPDFSAEPIPEPIPEPIAEPIIQQSQPEGMINVTGDVMHKITMFNDCVKNGRITKMNVTGLEEKLMILDSIIPKIVVDESVANTKLIQKIQESGYDVVFLGRGFTEKQVFEAVENQKAVLVTGNMEFRDVAVDNFTNVPIIINNANSVSENYDFIQRHMRVFER